jgi:HAD superfamily hydrolase (TIGR01509 family)
MTSLVFDCDGVLADTERDGHRVAFNQMFAEFGLPALWSEEEYKQALQVAGGKERLATLFTPEFAERIGFRGGERERSELIAEWHARKTQIYRELIASGRVPTRPGVRRIIREALAAGWRLAVASTSAEPAVRAVLDQAAGDDAERFDLVLAGDVVSRKKPAPDIYNLAVERLDVPRETVLVIEDSRNGLLAAVEAGLRCVVTVSTYTADEDLDEAVLVVSSLGDPDGEPTSVLANRGRAAPHEYVTLDDLADCLVAGGEAALPVSLEPPV